MKKMLFVYNPRSGKGLIRNHLSAIIEAFTAGDYEVTVRPTQGIKDACNIAREQAGNYDIIVCSGGDGTLDEVVTGVMESGFPTTVGYIPAGSTNDFGNSLGIPKQMENAANVIINGETFACDIGKFNQDYFVYVAAFGIFTDVSYQTNQDLKNRLGHVAYLLEGVKRMGALNSSYLKIESEEYTDEGEFVFGMITNSNSVGGFRGISGKNVELNDGLFEVMLVHAPQNLIDWQEIVTAILMFDKSNHNVVRFKTRHLVITSESPLAWTRDGENGGQHIRVELTNMREALKIRVKNENDGKELAIIDETER